MSMVKRFGPVKGAGVGVIEEASQEGIVASSLGWGAVIGQFERGEIHKPGNPKLNICTSRSSFDAKCGGRLPGYTATDVVQDYFEHGQGAGGMVAVRITDGHEETPSCTLYSRGWGADYHVPLANKDGQTQIKQALLRFSAKNAGRWGGRKRWSAKQIDNADVATALTETTLKLTGAQWPTNVWKDATLVLVTVNGAAMVYRTYTVLGNTVDTVRVAGDATMSTDMGITTEDLLVGLNLDSQLLDTGARKSLGIVVREAAVDPGANFGLECWLDGALVRKWDTCSMDPSSMYYVAKVVNDDKGNDYVTVEDLYAATGGGYSPDVRPANWYGRMVGALQARRVTINPVQITSVSSNKAQVVYAGMIGEDADPDYAAMLAAMRMPPWRATLTWNSTTHKYAIVYEGLGEKLQDVPLEGDFNVGAGAQYNKQVQLQGYVALVVDHTSEPDNGSTIVVEYLGLPWWGEYKGGYVLPDAKNQPLRRFRLKDNGCHATYLEIESGDMTALGEDYANAVQEGIEDGPFEITDGSKYMQVAIDGRTEVAVTLTTGGARTATQVASDINTAFDAVFGAGVLNPASASTDGKRLVLTSPGIGGQGRSSKIYLGPHDSSAYSTLGFTVPLSTGTTYYGTDGISPTTAELIAKAGPYAIVGATNDAFKVSVNGRTTITVTFTAGAARTAAQLVTEINAAFDAIFGVDNLNPAYVYTDDSGGTHLALRGDLSGLHTGPSSSLELETVTHSSYETLGLTEGITRGRPGAEVQLQFRTEPSGGYDGDVLTDQDYLDALAVGSSPLNKLLGKGYGVLQIATPDTTSTVVQKAGLAYGEAANHVYHVLVPSTYLDEQDVVDYVNTEIGRSDFGLCYFPSYVEVPDPDKEGVVNKEIPVSGEAMGRWALWARTYGSYVRPAAGLDATLPRVVDLPTEDKDLDQEVLVPQGVNPIVLKKGNYVLWGGRAINRSTAFAFVTHRLQLSHYEHTFMASFDWVIFQLNDRSTWGTLITAFRSYFLPEWRAGNVQGPTFEDAVLIKVDEELNTPEAIEAGDMVAAVGVRLPYYAERFLIHVSKLGVFEG